jgi:hypothetical protein
MRRLRRGTREGGEVWAEGWAEGEGKGLGMLYLNACFCKFSSVSCSKKNRFLSAYEVCVFLLFSTKPQLAGATCHGPGQLQLLGLWAIPSTESGPQPPLVTHNQSSLTLTPRPPPVP